MARQAEDPKARINPVLLLIEFYIEIRPNRGGHRGIAFQQEVELVPRYASDPSPAGPHRHPFKSSRLPDAHVYGEMEQQPVTPQFNDPGPLYPSF